MKKTIPLLLIAGSFATASSTYGAAAFNCGDVKWMLKNPRGTDGLYCDSCPADKKPNMQYKYNVAYICGPKSPVLNQCRTVYKCDPKPVATLRKNDNLPERAAPLSDAERGKTAKSADSSEPAPKDVVQNETKTNPVPSDTSPQDQAALDKRIGEIRDKVNGEKQASTPDGAGDHDAHVQAWKEQQAATGDNADQGDHDAHVQAWKEQQAATGDNGNQGDHDAHVQAWKEQQAGSGDHDAHVQAWKEQRATDGGEMKQVTDRATLRGDGSNTNGPKAANNTDRCKVSTQIGGEQFMCSDTEMWVEGAKYTNLIGQAVGSAAVQGVGMANANKAAKDGKMSSSMDAAAKTQELAAKSQMTLGAINAGLGITQLVMANKHKKNQEQLGAEVTEGNVQLFANGTNAEIRATGLTDQAIKKLGITRSGAAADGSKLLKDANAVLEDRGSKAEIEQAGIKKEAIAGGMLSLITGTGQLMQGGFNLAAAKNMKDAANKLSGAETKVPTFNLQGDEFVPRQAQTISGQGVSPSQDAAEEDDQVAKEDPNLGDGFADPLANTPENPGPAADPFKSASIAPSQGGGGGMGGGGSTGVAGSGDTDSAPQTAQSGEKIQYQGAGGAPATAGGRGGGKGSEGPDLSSLFAQLMPKSEEEAKMDQSILDFGGGRGPASESSILGRDSKSLFTRISEVNADKFKRGQLK